MSVAARWSTPPFSPHGAWSKVLPGAVREQLRQAFACWGQPHRLRVDNGIPWGSWGDFPTDLSLWVIGLGIEVHWNNPRSPQENGVVERSQGTSNRWCEPWTCDSPQELQARLDRMDRLYRDVYPYRERLSRTAYFPSLAHSGRLYDPAREPESWEWTRVTEHLATYAVTRRVDSRGQVSLYNRNHYVGQIHQGKEIYVMYDPNRNEWLFTGRDGQQLRTLPAEMLSPQRVMDLEVTHRRK
jgi:hypothetical protein